MRIVALLAMLAGCQDAVTAATIEPSAEDHSGEPVASWMDAVHHRIRVDEVTAPVASRLYAYTAIAMHEAVAAGMPDRGSLALAGMPEMPEPDPGAIDWPTAASVAAATVASGLFPSEDAQSAFQHLKDEQLRQRMDAGVARGALDRAVAHGERVGAATLVWAASDGYLATRGLPFEMPAEPGYWVPTAPGFDPCVEPFWGDMRPFTVDPDECAPPEPPPWSPREGSPFWKEAHAVWEASKALTPEQQEMAEFWLDDPGLSGTPAGHWVRIANDIVRDDALTLDRAVEVQAVLGIAQADAFISAWREKYRSCVMRPITYIDRYMEPGWEPSVATPAFPEYTSGHSVSAAAAAEALIATLGDRDFIDDTVDGMNPRPYASFRDAAWDSAIGRLYGGVHYPMAVDAGVEQGECIGRLATERLP